MIKKFISIFALWGAVQVNAQTNTKLQSVLDQKIKQVEPQLIEWRRHFHQNPELSNREKQTGAFIADYLKSLGLEVTYPVAKTGVVAVLKTEKPGRVVALRADMDGLPLIENNALPFASKVKTIFNGQPAGVMHACGHDAHMAMLMAVAKILSENKKELKGTIKFIFQPAEEGVGADEVPAGAALMVKEGVLENPKVDAIFGLHIQSLLPSGTLNYRPGPLMAAVDGFEIRVKGKGAHGATPWDGVDPVVVGSEIVNGLQTIVSRQTELTKASAVITVGVFHAGVRQNIIPDEAVLQGTIRTFDTAMQRKIHQKIRLTATKIAEASGAQAEVTIQVMYPATVNDVSLTQQAAKSLIKTVGTNQVNVIDAVTMAEDFSFYQQKIPGFFFFLGAYPADLHLTRKPTHHTVDFMIDENSFRVGVQALLNVTLDYLAGAK
ncbi:MAG: amidohydrolase [Bacteroidetes bacterium]|nr:amidohydrolase [Bacteroidota bacterium]